MAFCLGTLSRIVKKYEIDQLKTNEVFVNELLGCFVGGYAGLDKTVVSKILNCKCNAPDFLKQHLKDLNFNAKLSGNLYHYVEESFIKVVLTNFLLMSLIYAVRIIKSNQLFLPNLLQQQMIV